ncbi:MAG: Fe-S cluster assembly ATPase SufC [Deltaproteobacteria bacterium RIFCSPHIGHO2_12_FULL_43_9]|nr:MAG: Fe-S cluster assembly ATPase SufC [Deltaproteobacteria bacterium RIFCSPHIGHO2_12_FULL_43_9]
MKRELFRIEDLHISVEGKEVVKGLSLTVYEGEVHALMGRNGSGKTSLSCALLGHPNYKITSGRIFLRGKDVTGLSPEDRARGRMFLAFQYPVAIPGVSVMNFLRTAVKAVFPEEISVRDLRLKVNEKMKLLGMEPSFASRYVNDGFSGGEKKRLEILQMMMLEPQFAVLDETDSGLDIDALKIVAHGINTQRSEKSGILLITHYQRMLDYVRPDYVHVMIDGNIVRSGDENLARELESKGYDSISSAIAT